MIGGLILAAGGSSRFGAPKQLAELDGRPLIDHAVGAMLAVPAIGRVVVTLGANAERIAAEDRLENAEIVEVLDWEEGIAASLRAGVLSLESCDSVVITLADQPFVTAELISTVLEEAGDSLPSARATFGGKPGHPVVISSELFAGIGDLRGDDGARDLLEDEGCRHVEIGIDAAGFDIDTTDDLETARRESPGAGKERDEARA